MTYLSPYWRQKLLDAGFPAEELKLGVAEEILRRLPHMIDGTDGWMALLRIMPNEKEWSVFYAPVAGEKADTLANAAASIWTFLKSNDLIPND